MEIKFQNKTTPCITERFCEEKNETVWLEAVLTDTDSDVAGVLSMGTHTYLRGKDVTQGGITVSVEVETEFICTAEDGGLSFVNARKELTMDFDVPQAESDWQIIVELSSRSLSEKIVNSHKVGAEINVMCTVECYARDSITIADNHLQEEREDIHIKSRTEQVNVLSSASEKVFVISEPLYPKDAAAIPDKIIDSEVEYKDINCQFVAEKMIIKGNACLKVLYLPERSETPVSEEFMLPFTQLVNVGKEGLKCEKICIETTSAYVSVGYAINGEKMIETEIHAVSQTVLSESFQADIAENAYCNVCRCSCVMGNISSLNSVDTGTSEVEESFRLLPEDGVSEIVYAAAENIPNSSVPQIETTCIYKNTMGNFRWIRKNFALTVEGTRPGKIKPSSAAAHIDNEGIVIDTVISLGYEKAETRQIEYVDSLELDTDVLTDFDALPDIVLIKCEDEDLWETAQKYHSTVEEIRKINGEDIHIGNLLLIPKAR